MKDFRGKMTFGFKKPTELIDYFKNQPMEFAPGTKWKYNNSGYFFYWVLL
jgi:CubicO group peptidase (beta-lactamase class C family)